MNAIPRILCFLCVAAASVAQAALPTQADIFTICSFTSSKGNYVSSDYIFSALPFYQELTLYDYKLNAPWSKNAETQAGAIVLRDKSVFLFTTRSSKYLTIVDSSNHSTYYRLTKALTTRRKSPKPPADIGALPFPKPEDVFCVATFPWNLGKHFTPESLVGALPHFRPLTQRDVPAKAIVTATQGSASPTFYPLEWVQASRENEPLNGILVLTSGAVLRWFAWSAHAICFFNYHQNTFFVIDE